MKNACNYTRYGRVYNCKYYLILGSHNNCIINNFIDYGTYVVDYDQINRTILDENINNM